MHSGLGEQYVKSLGLKPSGFDFLFRTRPRALCETTWVVGIAQLTHHEDQGGGKNPETGGRGIFAPTADRVVS